MTRKSFILHIDSLGILNENLINYRLHPTQETGGRKTDIEKYIDRDGLFDSVLKNKLESLYSDLGWGALILNTNVSKFFKY